MTDLGLNSGNVNKPRWADCPLEPRVRKLESDMAVSQNDMSGIKDDIKGIPEAMGGLKTYMRISWILLGGVLVAVVLNAVSRLLVP